MIPRSSVLAFIVVICTVIEGGHALNCYNCSSVLDNKCGRTWDFSGTEGDKYLVKCVGNTVACRKLESTDSYKGELIVVRSCWNSSSVEVLDEEFLDCNKMASIGKACYCNKDLDKGKPCNGQQPLFLYGIFVVPAIVAISSLFF